MVISIKQLCVSILSNFIRYYTVRVDTRHEFHLILVKLYALQYNFTSLSPLFQPDRKVVNSFVLVLLKILLLVFYYFIFQVLSLLFY